MNRLNQICNYVCVKVLLQYLLIITIISTPCSGICGTPNDEDVKHISKKWTANYVLHEQKPEIMLCFEQSFKKKHLLCIELIEANDLVA